MTNLEGMLGIFINRFALFEVSFLIESINQSVIHISNTNATQQVVLTHSLPLSHSHTHRHTYT